MENTIEEIKEIIATRHERQRGYDPFFGHYEAMSALVNLSETANRKMIELTDRSGLAIMQPCQ